MNCAPDQLAPSWLPGREPVARGLAGADRATRPSAARAWLLSTPRRRTVDCSPIAAPAGRSAMAISVASALPIAKAVPSALCSFHCAGSPDSPNFDREQVFQWLRDHVDPGVH